MSIYFLCLKILIILDFRFTNDTKLICAWNVPPFWSIHGVTWDTDAVPARLFNWPALDPIEEFQILAWADGEPVPNCLKIHTVNPWPSPALALICCVCAHVWFQNIILSFCFNRGNFVADRGTFGYGFLISEVISAVLCLDGDQKYLPVGYSHVFKTTGNLNRGLSGCRRGVIFRSHI